jgi:transcriptional regulator with XRE-family HTH domain
MTTVPTSTRVSSIGSQVKKLRVSGRMTRRQLADAAGVSTEEVRLFERNLPVPLDSRRRMLKELWARKVRK